MPPNSGLLSPSASPMMETPLTLPLSVLFLLGRSSISIRFFPSIPLGQRDAAVQFPPFFRPFLLFAMLPESLENASIVLNQSPPPLPFRDVNSFLQPLCPPSSLFFKPSVTRLFQIPDSVYRDSHYRRVGTTMLLFLAAFSSSVGTPYRTEYDFLLEVLLPFGRVDTVSADGEFCFCLLLARRSPFRRVQQAKSLRPSFFLFGFEPLPPSGGPSWRSSPSLKAHCVFSPVTVLLPRFAR